MRAYKQILIFLIIIFANLVLSNNNISIRIMATANVHNETDPCGRKKKPLGGLARKATILNKLKETNNNLYIVDAGNLFFKTDIIDPGISHEVAIINDGEIIKQDAPANLINMLGNNKIMVRINTKDKSPDLSPFDYKVEDNLIEFSTELGTDEHFSVKVSKTFSKIKISSEVSFSSSGVGIFSKSGDSAYSKSASS